MDKFYNNVADKMVAIFKDMPLTTLIIIEVILICIAVACIITAIVLSIKRLQRKQKAPEPVVDTVPYDAPVASEAVAEPAVKENAPVVAEEPADDKATDIGDSDLPWEYIRKVIVPGEVVEPVKEQTPVPEEPKEKEAEASTTVAVDGPSGKVSVSVSGTKSQVADLVNGKMMIIFAHDINFNMGGPVGMPVQCQVQPKAPVKQIPVEEVVEETVKEPEVTKVEEPVVEEVAEEPAVEEVVEEPVVEEVAEEPAVEEVVEEEVAEEPAVEEPAEEEVAEEIVEEPAEEEVAEDSEDEESDDDDDDAAAAMDDAEGFANGKRNTIRMSFTARLTLATPEKQEFYSKIKNEFLRYKGVKCRRSWNGESFNKGRTQIAKIAIKGKTLSVYFGVLDMNNYLGTKYHFEDVSDTKKYAETPMKMKVRSNRSTNYVIELFSEIGNQLGLKYINKEEVSYLPEPKTYEELREMGEIRKYGD